MSPAAAAASSRRSRSPARWLLAIDSPALLVLRRPPPTVSLTGTQDELRRNLVANLETQSFERSNEVSEHPDGSARAEIVELNGRRIVRATMQPGWRWSVHGRPTAGTDSCEVEHIGYLTQGRLAVLMDDGNQIEIGAGEAYHVPPGHDAWVVGDEAVVNVDFSALAS